MFFLKQSFGMLLWELAFEKIPYENWDMNQIREHVLSNKREKIIFGKELPTIEKLQKNYAKIIVSGKRLNVYFLMNVFTIVFIYIYIYLILISLAR